MSSPAEQAAREIVEWYWSPTHAESPKSEDLVRRIAQAIEQAEQQLADARLDYQSVLSELQMCEQANEQARDRVRELELEIIKQKHVSNALGDALAVLPTTPKQMMERVRVLEAALRKHGRHDEHCSMTYTTGNPESACDCGYSAALAGTEEQRS